jgi:hypothetical protein
MLIAATVMVAAWLAPSAQAEFVWDAYPDLDIGTHPSGPFFQDIQFNTSTYTTQTGENLVCGTAPNKATGANTAWLHFEAPVAGQLAVGVVTHEQYFGMLQIYVKNNPPSACAYARDFHEEPKAGVHLAANVFVDIQTLGVEIEERNGVELDDSPLGGLTDVLITFTPDDVDGDKVPDTLDACPGEAGPAALQGCPDSDGDGIANRNDRCPTLAGVARFEGCPDTDGDGIPDAQDKCPTRAGPASFEGCPDSDGDGIGDNRDQCPTQFALAAISGPVPAGGPRHPGCLEALTVARIVKGLGEMRSGVAVRLWTLTAPAGSVVRIGCIGRACGHRRAVKLTSNGSAVRMGPLLARGALKKGGRLWLPAGTTITVELTHAGALGRLERYSIRRGRSSHRAEWTFRDRCISPAGGTETCPA